MALWRDFNRTVGDGIVRPGLFSLMVLMDENPGVAQIELATQLAIDKAKIALEIHERWHDVAEILTYGLLGDHPPFGCHPFG